MQLFLAVHVLLLFKAEVQKQFTVWLKVVYNFKIFMF